MTGQKSRIGLGIARQLGLQSSQFCRLAPREELGGETHITGMGGPGQMTAITECIRVRIAIKLDGEGKERNQKSRSL